MRHSVTASFLLLIAISGRPVAADGEAGTTVAEPQYMNSFCAVDVNGKLIELERQAVTFRAKVKALPGYASIKMTTEFKPGHSPVRLPATAQVIVRGRLAIDPQSRFELRALNGSKSHREAVMTKGHGSVFGTSVASNPEEGAIAVRFEEYGDSSYRITPDRPLKPGEYALGIRGFASELYCFGVDRE
jgi:hypothetical protein